ncbi:N-acetyltransferase [Lachnospiraceae bacterium]|nr:N-acetyltransferase [Lachnospiraceae bacterium]
MMKNQSLTASVIKISIEDSVHKVMDIFEKEDGKTFEEKKKEAISYLKDKENTLLAERLIDIATNDEMGKKINHMFWEFGECITVKDNIILRKVQDSDKDIFIELQEENNIVKSMLKEEAYRNMLWNEHIEYKALMFSIIVNDEYVGYCGIKNITHEQWEIAIEILYKWKHKGIGYKAVSVMLDEIKNRLNVSKFRVRIDAENYPSQKLFEKLGAEPNGISEFMLHGEADIQRCEEENLHLIDERMQELASKFNVEPKKLLSHVLEYRLVWN